MTYENAPSTRLVATNCACCARPLVDADSVEAGVGPECRKRHGFGVPNGAPDWNRATELLGVIPGDKIPPGLYDAYAVSDAHAASNALVNAIAIDQHGAHCAQFALVIDALGYVRLAERIIKRLGTVHVLTFKDRFYSVSAPYQDEFVDLIKRVPGRRWDAQLKANIVPQSEARTLADILRACYPGFVCISDKGKRVL
jgi:hypothetical protein